MVVLCFFFITTVRMSELLGNTNVKPSQSFGNLKKNRVHEVYDG